MRKTFLVMLLVLLSLSITTAAASMSQFAGSWKNVDPNTGGVTTLDITVSGTVASVHAWGKCHPTDCDWGSAKAYAFGPDVSSDLVSSAQAMIASYDSGFSQTTMVLQPAGANRLKATTYTRFTDNSGRSNYVGEYTFQRESAAPSVTPSSPGIGTPSLTTPGSLMVPGTLFAKLPAPVLVSPAKGSVFDTYPRTLNLRWKPVSGAASYTVEVDCFHCCKSGKWCTNVGVEWKVVPGITDTKYTFDFVGAQPGRWRVWAVDSSGNSGFKSDWWEFEYTT